jgi:hypothetical protein
MDELLMNPSLPDEYRPGREFLSNSEIAACGTLAQGAYLNISRELLMRRNECFRLKAVLERAVQLSGGWREAIVELEDFCSEPVRLKNMIAAADQLDEWAANAKAALSRGEQR